MPHTRSAKKRLRQNEKRRQHNRATKKAIKKQIKGFLALVETGTAEQVREEYSKTAKKLDKAAAKRVIHPNLAARKKSQLQKKVNAKAAQPATA
jgi:small subunit ribosomal protein S20